MSKTHTKRRKVMPIVEERLRTGELNVSEFAKAEGMKENSVYKALQRLGAPKVGRGVYKHPKQSIWARALEEMLIELDSEFRKNSLSSNPNLNKLVRLTTLYERLRSKTEQKISKRYEGEKEEAKIEEMIRKETVPKEFIEQRVDEFIEKLGVRVRIGGIDFP
ncbi:MAG: hypothetical protein QXF26_05770 [Candidatus Bathyarchaeia archaeon]